MRFDCGPTWRSQWELIKEGAHPRQQWRRWYAWRPVRVGENECRWLEWVERKETYETYWDETRWESEYR